MTDSDTEKWSYWRYTGTVERVYAFTSRGPHTVNEGDVIVNQGPPAGDGCWEPVGDDGTASALLPDNHDPDRDPYAAEHDTIEPSSTETEQE